MIRLGVIGTSGTGKSALARHATAPPDTDIIEAPPLTAPSKRLKYDAYLLVCDKDLIDIEFEQVALIAAAHRPVGICLNKSDTYSKPQLRQVLMQIRRRADRLLPADRVVAAAAEPVRIVLRQKPGCDAVEQTLPADRDLGAVNNLLQRLAADAANSMRVRARGALLRSRAFLDL
jgi:predicted GTPase